jgi:hypothetical protein
MMLCQIHGLLAAGWLLNWSGLISKLVSKAEK